MNLRELHLYTHKRVSIKELKIGDEVLIEDNKYLKVNNIKDGKNNRIIIVYLKTDKDGLYHYVQYNYLNVENRVLIK